MSETIQHTSSPATVVVSVDPRPYDKRQHLLQELIKNGELLLKSRLEVRHLMTRDPIAIAPTMTVEEMESVMQQQRLRHLPVCGRSGELLGMVSDRDLRRQHGMVAQQVMSLPVLTATPETPLSPAITFLINENISCLPVVDQGRLCGILTTTDLVLTLQCMLQLWTRMAQVLQHDSAWARELDQLIASLDDNLSPSDFAARAKQVRATMRRQVDDIVNNIDLETDVLTGLSNRRGLEDTLGMLLAMQKRYGQPLSLVIVTIDQYQRIQKTCGEAVTNSLVRAAARLLRESVRRSDCAARCRDETFAVVLTQTDAEQAAVFCRRLRGAAKRTAYSDIPLRITTSIFSPEPDEDVARFLDRAETAVMSHPSDAASQ